MSILKMTENRWKIEKNLWEKNLKKKKINYIKGCFTILRNYL